MRSLLLDTSVYVDDLREGGSHSLLDHESDETLLWLSAVVLEELYAGASTQDLHFVESLERVFIRLHRVLVPNLDDWVQAGRLLAKLAAKHGYERIGRGRLTNDALIAVSAARLGIVVVTKNTRDFSRIAEFHSFGWETV